MMLTLVRYNGMPFEVGVKWETAVPEIGIFCCEYVVPWQRAPMAPTTQRLDFAVEPPG